MIKKETIFLAGLFIVSSSLFAQTKLDKGLNKKEFGIQYMLPKTHISIQINEKKTVYSPGEFCQYAERFLKLSNVQPDASARWDFVNAKIFLTATPDSDKVFFVGMNEKTIAPLMNLTPDGIIKSINMPLPSATTEIKTDTPKPAVKDAKAIDPHSLLTEEILMAGSTAKMAELVAKEIYSIRDSRSELVRGQADNLPKDGAQLKLMLDNLDAHERALTSLFTGTYQYEEKTITVPLEIKEMDNSVCFRFSAAEGVVDKDDLSGRPFFLSLKDLKSIDTHVEVKDKLKGIAYNMPGRAQITLSDGNKTLINIEYPVTQFGTLEYLAPTLFNKKSTVSVEFDPVTGGLINVNRTDNK